ncbi:DNA recombination protein RmuC [Phycicoccus elongatus]|uniref:DNA recombination protein RmuC n=1 Tax=Phycicoccus elongatus TaxID=101689 RepID=UPI002B6DFDAC|nr:DNA recombination protein RmuC [Phycicoccus elongatus]HPF76935.1 DNA recombination protein RmuC [Phycicoccus elongatus]
MEIPIVAVLTACAGLVGFLIARVGYAARLAAATTEAALLRERVDGLEAALAQDQEAAALLAPLRDTLGRVEAQVGGLERERAEQFGSIHQALRRVESGTGELSRTTANLVGSLRSSTVRGAWGEVQLRRVLELAGMLARCDFDEQVSTTTVHGAVVRPDVVVRLPGHRQLVVDAKAPMMAFLDAQADGLDEEARDDLLADHARALRAHVAGLARKEYWSAFEATPELVVCFVPSDAVLAAALARDPALHEWALDSKVALVGPATLLALLRTAALAWQQDAVTASAAEVSRLGRDLYARLATLGEHTARLGRSLTSSVEAYNAFVGTMESRVLVSARRMNDLGIVSTRLPDTAPLDATPRVLTAAELIDAAVAQDARPELDLGLTPDSGSAAQEVG